jgi:hypothetical protein|tara:strand:- start:27 stop:482 length:456 start_codon:yes stop_codon:yes gene_type:complete
MDPTIWGPKLWFVIHTVTFNYSTNPTNIDKKVHFDFFMNLRFTIPCELCRNHYTQHLQKHPLLPNLSNKDFLVKWGIDLHNEVNKSLNKRVLSYEEVMNYYKEEYRKSDSEYNTSYFKAYWYTSIIVILILIGIYLYFKCIKKRRIFPLNY